MIISLRNKDFFISQLLSKEVLAKIQNTAELVSVISALDDKDDVIRQILLSKISNAQEFLKVILEMNRWFRSDLIKQVLHPEVISNIQNIEELVSGICNSNPYPQTQFEVACESLHWMFQKDMVLRACFRQRIEVLFEREIGVADTAGDADLGLVLRKLHRQYRSAPDSANLAPFIYQLERDLSHPKGGFFSNRSSDARTEALVRSGRDLDLLRSCCRGCGERLVDRGTIILGKKGVLPESVTTFKNALRQAKAELKNEQKPGDLPERR